MKTIDKIWNLIKGKDPAESVSVIIENGFAVSRADARRCVFVAKMRNDKNHMAI